MRWAGGHEPMDRLRQGLRVLGGNAKSCIANDVGAVADVGNGTGNAASHGLPGGIGKAFTPRGRAGDIQRGCKSGHIVPFAKQKKPALHLQFCDQLQERRLLFGLATDEDEPDLRVRSGRQGSGAQESSVVFDGMIARNQTDEDRVFPDS